MRVYPLWPAVVRLNTTPAEGLSGRLVYIGEGNVDEVPAASLRGQIAVMEMTGGRNWHRAMTAGATAIIQPGGSMRDDEVIAAADEAGLAMVLTGMRHFRH